MTDSFACCCVCTDHTFDVARSNFHRRVWSIEGLLQKSTWMPCWQVWHLSNLDRFHALCWLPADSGYRRMGCDWIFRWSENGQYSSEKPPFSNEKWLLGIVPYVLTYKSALYISWPFDCLPWKGALEHLWWLIWDFGIDCPVLYILSIEASIDRCFMQQFQESICNCHCNYVSFYNIVSSKLLLGCYAQCKSWGFATHRLRTADLSETAVKILIFLRSLSKTWWVSRTRNKDWKMRSPLS